jgi:alpha-tubulin suppressor-like RCC1 family protein
VMRKSRIPSFPTPVAAMAGIRVRSVVAGREHSLALGWDGRVHSWESNFFGQLGRGDRLDRTSRPAREAKYTRGGRVFCIIRIFIVFCIVFVFLGAGHP